MKYCVTCRNADGFFYAVGKLGHLTPLKMDASHYSWEEALRITKMLNERRKRATSKSWDYVPHQVEIKEIQAKHVEGFGVIRCP
jgi:hypothetical protein